mgnify:CR=1 FL=1
MGLFDRFRRPQSAEARNLENPSAPVSAADFLQVMGWGDLSSASGVNVTIENALGVPAVWAATNFISGTLASLPLEVFQKTATGREPVTVGIGAWIDRAVNPHLSSFGWRKYTFEQVLTGGRSVTQIVRSGRGDVTDLIPLDPSSITVSETTDAAGFPTKAYRTAEYVYSAEEVLDLPFMVKANQLDKRSPIFTNKDVIANTTAKLAREGRSIMALPAGHELKSIGFSPDQMQLLPLQQFCIEQIARIYSLPPIFLQDLSHGTYSNTEQQDLHFVKHTLRRWIEQAEAEMNLKLFGRSSDVYIRYNVDSLLRGDFKTRMEAHATSIQNGIRTPNEVRALEDMLPLPDGDQLMIQGATVPISSQGSPANEV